MSAKAMPTRRTQLRHRYLSRKHRRQTPGHIQETSQTVPQDTLLQTKTQEIAHNIAKETLAKGQFADTVPIIETSVVIQTAASTPSSAPSVTSGFDSDQALLQDLMSIFSGIKTDTQLVAFLDTTSTANSFQINLSTDWTSEITTPEYISTGAYISTATETLDTPTMTAWDTTSTVTLAPSDTQNTPSSTLTGALTSSIGFSSIYSSDFITLAPTIHSHPHVQLFSPSAPSPPVASPSATPSLVPITPEDSAQHGQPGPPVHKLIIVGLVFLSLTLLMLVLYVYANWSRFVAWCRRTREPKEVDWDFSTKYVTWDAVKEVSTKMATSESQKDLRSRFSAATSASVYSSVTSARSSTNSDYWIDPRYVGPETAAPATPPALDESSSVDHRCMPETSRHTMSHDVLSDMPRQSVLPVPMRPPTPKESPLLPPGEFFSLPSTKSLHHAESIGKHERTGSAPVFGYISTGEGGLRERREAGMSRASRAMSRALAKDGISGVSVRASGVGPRRSNSVSVLMDYYLSPVESPRWL